MLMVSVAMDVAHPLRRRDRQELEQAHRVPLHAGGVSAPALSSLRVSSS